MSNPPYILGVDIGTTSVKICIYNPSSKEVVAIQKRDTAANVPSELGTEGNKQDVPTIVSTIHGCLSRLPRELLKCVGRIGICGQMHSVLLWRQGENKAWTKVEKDGSLIRYDVPRDRVSALYTWQDTRCKPEFLDTLPKPDSHLKCYSGYGCATLLWLAKNKPEKLKSFSHAGTIQDFVVGMLCDLDTAVMSDQNAASWGYFNTKRNEWNVSILESIDFPVRLLPKVLRSSAIAGRVAQTIYGIPVDTPVGVAMGDLQCSFLATLEKMEDAVLNISTSAQLGFVVDEPAKEYETVEYLPYFDGKYLAVAASLNGGNTLASFVKMLQQWFVEFGFSIPQSKLWEKLISLGSQDLNSENLMNVHPILLGERHAPNQRASVDNINLSNMNVGRVFKSLCHGVISNLHDMIPRDVLAEANIERIVGNGSGLSRNVVLQKAVEHQYHLPLEFTSGGDAAKGAAVAVIGL